MTHITRLQADNFKKLTVIDIYPGTPAGVVPIRGRNAQGKSSTLDAIMAALGGKGVMPSRPVREGADEGAIRLELSDGAVILRRFTVDGKGDSIEITNAEGFKAPSPQKMLDGLYASVAFDPLAFTRLDPKAQLQTLRALVKLDVDIDKLELQNKIDYDGRRDVNRDVATAETALARMPTFEKVPQQNVDEAALEQKITEAAEHNGSIEARKVKRAQFLEQTEAFRQRIVAIDEEIEALEDKLAAMKETRADVVQTIADREKQVEEAEDLPEPIDVAQVQEDLRAARETNRKIEAQAAYLGQQEYLASIRKKSDDLTAAMDARKKQIADAIERADMPVEGLTFGDGEVLFGGIPLAQASSAEQLRVSTAIGMASSPKLRVMLVRDGSLLDDDGQKILADLAAENDFQLWVEAVDTSGKVGIVLEDGAVIAIDGEDAPEPEAIEKVKRRVKKPDENEKDAGGPSGAADPAGDRVGASPSSDGDTSLARSDTDVAQEELAPEPGPIEPTAEEIEQQQDKVARAAPTGLFD